MSISQLSQLAAYEATQPGHKLVLMISPGWPMLAPTQQQKPPQKSGLGCSTPSSILQMACAKQGWCSMLSIRVSLGAQLNPFYYEEYLKGVSSPDKAEYANLGLQVFAVQSGGTAQVTGTDVAGELKNDMRDAGTYYRLTFAAQPGDQPNEYHALEVKVTAPDAKVRTSAGYYANTRQLDVAGAK